MNRLIRFITALGLLGLALFQAKAMGEISLSLWLATGVLFTLSIFLQDNWQLLTIPLAIPLFISLYQGGNNQALALALLSLIAVINNSYVGLILWVLSGGLFLLNGFMYGWQIDLLPYICLGLVVACSREESKKPQILQEKDNIIRFDYEENLRLKKENTRIKALLANKSEALEVLDKQSYEKLGLEFKAVTAKLALLIFELKVMLEPSVISGLSTLNDLETNLSNLQKIIPSYWPELFFRETLGEILTKTALEKKAVLHLKLKKLDLKVGEKYVLNEVTRYFLEENKKLEISLEEGQAGLFYVLRPIIKEELEPRLLKLVAGIGGTIIFDEEELYIIWRVEDESSLSSTS